MFKALSLAALAVAAATPAFAAEATKQPPRAVVRIADLDLGSQAGRTELDRRVAAAVRRVCPKPKTPDLPSWRSHASCVDAAGRSADAQRELATQARAPRVAGIVSAAR